MVFTREYGLDSTVQWEGYRAGVLDGKYIYTLEHLIRQATGSKDQHVRTLAREFKEWLEGVKQQVPLKMFGQKSENWLIKNGDRLRREMAQRIYQLQSAMSPK